MNRRAALPAAVGVVVLSACASRAYVIGRFHDESCAAHGDALVCSGFEQPDLSDWTRVVMVDDAVVEQSDARSHRGAGSLFAQSTGPESAAVVALDFPAVTDGELYLRAFMYVPSNQPTKTLNFLFLGDYAAPDPFKGIDFNLEDGALSTYVPGGHPDRFTSTTLVIPRDRWFCLQVQLTIAESAGALTIRVDGEVGLEQKNMNTRPPGGLHLLRAGIDWSSGQAERFELYLDDLVLARTLVACEEQ